VKRDLDGVTRDQMLRAGRAVEARMAERMLGRSALARRAEVDPKTLRALLTGERWPRVTVRARIEAALGWPSGEIHRRARGERPLAGELSRFPELDLLTELVRRARGRVPSTQGS
jgi:hypothetical protein